MLRFIVAVAVGAAAGFVAGVLAEAGARPRYSECEDCNWCG